MREHSRRGGPYHLSWWLLRMIDVYRRHISPFLGSNCRYHPTCSLFALQAIEMHGGAKGMWLAARRLGRCHPMGKGGVDMVPPPSLGKSL